MPKVIFRDFDHWWGTSKAHGMTSASRDWMREIWDELQPTIEASQGDYKKAYLALMQEQADHKSEITTALLDYVKEFRQDGQPKFFKWWFDREIDK